MKKLLLIGAILLGMASCSSLQVVDPNAAMQAGAAAVQALTISDAQVVQLCKEYMVQSDAENKVLPKDNPYSQRLARIMSQFKNISDLNVNYAVYQSNVVNAFACGDGSVRVYSGLMDVMNDEEVFAVIGHELGHVRNKDTRDAYRNAYLMVAARYGIGAVSQTGGMLSTGMVGDIAQQLASNAYSRKQEYEADDAALQFCLTNGVNPYAMYNSLNVLMRLSNTSGGSNTITQMFSTHPDTAKRAARAKSLADAAGGGKAHNTGNSNSGSSGSSTPGKVNVKPSGNNSGNSSGSGSSPVIIKKN